MSTLRIATLNIWNKSGPWLERLALIRREIERLQPAVLGLQEVLRFAPNGRERFEATPATCQATEIAQGFDYQIAYAEASDYGGGLKRPVPGQLRLRLARTPSTRTGQGSD